MADFIIRTGDSIKVTIPPPAIVPALEGPIPLTGSANSLTVLGASACLLGDELPEALRQPLAYTAPPFTNEGIGMLTLTLQPSNMTAQTRNGKQILVKGGPFTAMFTVETPATQTTPAGPLADTVTVKEGTAQFVTSNETVRAG
jgi:hypothetical protein